MLVLVVVLVVIVVVIVILCLGPLARLAHPVGAAALRDRGPAARRLVDAAAPFELVLVVAGDDQREVRRALAHSEVPAASTGLAPLPGRTLVGVRDREEQLVGRQLVVVLGVGDRGVEHLQHVVGRVLLAQLQHAERVVDRQASHEVEDLAHLVGRHVQVAGARERVRGVDGDGHYRRLDRSCPAWYRNVRVGANSPSL